MTVLTFGFKAKDFGNSWSSFWRELRRAVSLTAVYSLRWVYGLFCQRLGLTWRGTSYMIPIVYRFIDSYSVLRLIVYRGTCLTCVSSFAWLSWLPSLTWRTWGTLYSLYSCVTIVIWISFGSISIINWQERRLDILNLNPRCYSIPLPNRNEESNLRKSLPSEVHKSNRNREFKIPDKKAQDPRRRKYWFGLLADRFSMRSVFIFRGKTLAVFNWSAKYWWSRFLGNSTRWYRKFFSFAQTAETVYNSRSREQGMVKQDKLEDNKIYRWLASVKEAVLLSSETSEVF